MAHSQSSPRGLFAKARIDVAGTNLTGNSTGMIFSGAVYASGSSSNKAITADTTGVIVGALKIGSWSTAITVDSTGILLGALYISCNSTGNTTT